MFGQVKEFLARIKQGEASGKAAVVYKSLFKMVFSPIVSA
jgi:hypothetical protein